MLKALEKKNKTLFKENDQEVQLEKLSGIVERVTFHNEQNGWSILKLKSFRDPNKLTTVVIHQIKVFAGASMEFYGQWTHHPKHGEQFKATNAIETKPATAAALEKYLGSGLIKGVGPVTAKQIVKHFKAETLNVFENDIDLLLTIPGIAHKKLSDIKISWVEHKAIRDVMIFLQEYGISTLFAVKIFKFYGSRSISVVSENPYLLAKDIYGIGFFSADKIALSMGFEVNGIPRIEAAIRHVLASSREDGHCYLTYEQIQKQTAELLNIIGPIIVAQVLQDILKKQEIKKRDLMINGNKAECYYSNSLYFAENYVAQKCLKLISKKMTHDKSRINNWINQYCERFDISLSPEQLESIIKIPQYGFSILTGGPGCGKTTSTKVLVKLLMAMKLKITLAAPTGRAAQRMTEVIGIEAKTIHRLLGWSPEKNGFKRDETDPLKTDFLIIDECSMLDISLAASLMKAIDDNTQLLFIGDPDQLPSVGAGNVLYDMLESDVIPKFQLTKVFRQAENSSIIQFAHKINKGEVPQIRSPIAEPALLKSEIDCFFFDSEEATLEQVKFLNKARFALKEVMSGNDQLLKYDDQIKGKLSFNDGVLELDESDELAKLYNPDYNLKTIQAESILNIPDKFKHVDILKLSKASSDIEELKSILKKIHPWSSIHHGLTASETLLRLYSKTIPDILGKNCEIQILSPQVRGTLGTLNLNQKIQEKINPAHFEKRQITIGEKIFREGDRVIQIRNNYDLGVFNGDIGKIKKVDLNDLKISVEFDGHKKTKDELVEYAQVDLSDLALAYAITIHKSQGSEFQAVIIPVTTQHFNMLFRNLIYTGLTRAKKLAIFIGSRKALSLAVKSIDQRVRQTALKELLKNT
jgi:exodeoxyribonuclease V alpha subunit